MSLEHDTLRELPPVEVLGALIAAVVDSQRGDPIRSVYTLISVAQVMAQYLPLEDQMLAALELHRAALDLLPARPLVRQNGHRVELVK